MNTSTCTVRLTGLRKSYRVGESSVEALKGVSRGGLHLAVASTVNYFAPRLLAVFHQRYPGIAPRLDVTNREALIRLLENNSIDLALMGVPPTEVEVES